MLAGDFEAFNLSIARALKTWVPDWPTEQYPRYDSEMILGLHMAIENPVPEACEILITELTWGLLRHAFHCNPMETYPDILQAKFEQATQEFWNIIEPCINWSFLDRECGVYMMLKRIEREYPDGIEENWNAA